MGIKTIEIILGTEYERVSINVIDMAFPGYTRKFFRANGVATANDSATCEERNIKQNNFEEQRRSDFLQYSVRHVENKLAKYIISSGEDQLWTSNNTESMNHRLNVKLN
ncbi:hypothetical protein ACJMK2_008432 [Sinanodonta woodiana]|uniref:Uncharacterized protein n=1 Tax=Sinanodonta woodiana TaxID=1069815 RepID=A0ABD3VPK2_SINWO